MKRVEFCRAVKRVLAAIGTAAGVSITALGTPVYAYEPAQDIDRGTQQKAIVESVVNRPDFQAVPLIMDLDMSGDTDDLIAMRIAQEYDEEGLVDLKGVILSENTADGLAQKAACGICDAYGFTDTYIGYNHSPVLEDPERYPYWEYLSKQADSDQHNIDESVRQYRKILAQAEDKSVGIVIVGYFNSISDFLKSGPDYISPLTGQELFQQKVKFCDVCGVRKAYSSQNYRAGFENNSCFYGTGWSKNFYDSARAAGVPVYQYNEERHMAAQVIVGGDGTLDEGDVVRECFVRKGRQHTGGPGWDAIAAWSLLPIIDGNFQNYGIEIQPYSVRETGADDGYFESRPADTEHPANVEIMDFTWDIPVYEELIQDAY